MTNDSFSLREALRSARDFFADAPAVRRIASAATAIGSAYIVVVLATAAREILIAREFGVNDQLDAFVVAYSVVLFIVWVSNPTFQSAVIPTFVRVRERDGHDAGRRFFSGAMALLAIALTAAALLLVMVFPLVLPHLVTSYPPEKLELTRELFLRLSPVIVIGGLNGAALATLSGAEHFAIPGLTPAITPAVMVLTIVFGKGRITVLDLAYAVVAGSLLESAATVAQLRRAKLLPRPVGPVMSDEMRTVVRQYVLLLAGSATMSMTTIVDQLMAARLGSGASSTLSYGSKVVAIGSGMASLVVGTAVMPFFSKMIALRDWRGLRATLRATAVAVIGATIPITIALVVFAEPLVKLLFQRGQFGAADTAAVSQVQRFLALQIPFYAAMIPLVRAISAFRANHILTTAAVINLVCNITLNALFMRFMGLPGIALSTACVYAISFGYTLVMLRRLLAAADRGELV